ncbi:hypothetical protein Tco_0502378 [Tanacetum coccineum]
MVLKPHCLTITLVVSQTSTLTTGESSLIPSSNRYPTISGYVAKLLAISALYSAWSFMVKIALVAQRKRISNKRTKNQAKMDKTKHGMEEREKANVKNDSFSIDDIEYVDASPPDFELVSLEAVESVIPEVGGIDTDILLTIKDDILHENF